MYSEQLDEKIKLIKSEESEKKILTYAYRLLAIKDYSPHALKNKLKSRFLNQNLIDQVIEMLKQEGYLNEIRYAEILIQNRIKKGRSKNLILDELKAEKINISSQFLEEQYEYLGLSELEQIDKLVSKSTRRINTDELNFDEKRKLKEKIMGQLMRKGFNYDQIAKSLKKFGF